MVRTKEGEPDLSRADIPVIEMYRPGGYNEAENKKEGKEEECTANPLDRTHKSDKEIKEEKMENKKEEKEEKCKAHPLAGMHKSDREIKEEKMAGDEKDTISVQSEEEGWGREEEVGKASHRSSKSTVRAKRDPDCTRYVALSASSGTLTDSDIGRAESPPPGTYSGVEEDEYAEPETPDIYGEMAKKSDHIASGRNRSPYRRSRSRIPALNRTTRREERAPRRHCESYRRIPRLPPRRIDTNQTGEARLARKRGRSTVARRGRRSRSNDSTRRHDRTRDTRTRERTQTQRCLTNQDTPLRRQDEEGEPCVGMGLSLSPNYAESRIENERKSDMHPAGQIDGRRYLTNQDIHAGRKREEGSSYTGRESSLSRKKSEERYQNQLDAPTTSMESATPAIPNNDHEPCASNRCRFTDTTSSLGKRGLSEKKQSGPRSNWQKSQSIAILPPYAAIPTDRTLEKRAIGKRGGPPPGNKSGVESDDRGVREDSSDARGGEGRQGRKRRRRMVSYSDAAKTVTCYRANYQRDLEQAEEIWSRLEDPSLGEGDGPLHGCTEKAIWYDKKGKEFTELSRKYESSKAAQVLRSDARRLGGPIM